MKFIEKLKDILPISQKDKQTEEAPYENKADLAKLMMHVTIVSRGQGQTIVKFMQSVGSSAQFIFTGNGTANKQILDILNIADNKKDVVISLIKADLSPTIKQELDAFFAANKRNKGIGFSIPMTSIIGVNFYRFLTDSL